MIAMEIIGAGLSEGPSPELLTAFKRRTLQRHVDPAVGAGLAALDATGIAPGIVPWAFEPWRIGLLLATDAGPADTRLQYLDSYAGRGGKSVSATLFANCGYNIAGAMLARSRGIRGPVLTFGADRHWGGRLLATAARLFAAGRVDRLLVGRAEAGGAVMLALAPAVGDAPNPVIAASAGIVELSLPTGERGPLSCFGWDEDVVLRGLAGIWRECRQ